MDFNTEYKIIKSKISSNRLSNKFEKKEKNLSLKTQQQILSIFRNNMYQTLTNLLHLFDNICYSFIDNTNSRRAKVIKILLKIEKSDEKL